MVGASCTLKYISKNDIDDNWQKALPLLDRACLRSGERYNAEDLRNLIKTGDFQLWLVMDNDFAVAALVTEMLYWPKLRELRMIIMVGDKMEKWLDLLPLIERYAKDIGCAKISGVARAGWGKMLKHYQKTHVFLEKDL